MSRVPRGLYLFVGHGYLHVSVGSVSVRMSRGRKDSRKVEKKKSGRKTHQPTCPHCVYERRISLGCRTKEVLFVKYRSRLYLYLGEV